MSYKITKSETKKIGTIKLPKGVWLNHTLQNGFTISINPEICFCILPDSLIEHISKELSNYKPYYNNREIVLNTVIKIDYNCTKSDVTNEWTFYEKVEDTVKVKPDSVEEIWTGVAYKFSKGL